MKDRFQKNINRESLPEPNSSVLVAVSGGIDSMVLAHLLIDCGYVIGIAHCNFALRNKESDEDESFVRDFATRNGLRFHSIKFDTTKYASESKISIQMAARDLRYQWFEKIRKENGYHFIAVAHNLNDNAETILINLTRGTGISGLTGMKAIAGKIVRPLLFATRKEIEQYATENKISFREDSSNASTKYTRNSIRHLVIPALEKINPSFIYSINDTARNLADSELIVNLLTEEFSNRAIIKEDERVRVVINELRKTNFNNVLLLQLFGVYGLTPSMLGEMVKLLHGKTGAVLNTVSHRFLKNRNELIITKVLKSISSPQSFTNVNQIKKSGLFTVRVFNATSGFKPGKDKATAYLDADILKFPLILRRWKEGDSFVPFGMKGKKKISDFFTDLKYSLADKENTLILESDSRIVWVAGVRIDDRFRVSEKTARVLMLKLKKRSQEP